MNLLSTRLYIGFFILIFVFQIQSFDSQITPNKHSLVNSGNCSKDCSYHGTCNSATGNCTCTFGYSGPSCETNWGRLYKWYRYTFAVLFAIIGSVALIQLIRFIVLDGFTPTIQKFLHLVFFLLGVGRLCWLLIDPHNVLKILPAIVENVLYGSGVYFIIFAYLLVVMLWSQTYQKASIGNLQSWVIKHTTAIFIFVLIFTGVVELLLLVLWRLYAVGSATYIIIIGLFYLLLVLVLIVAVSSFLFYGLRLYKNLLAFEAVNPLVKDRLSRITLLTVGSTLVSIATFLWVCASYILEMYKYKFENMQSFLIEQFGFRALEVILSSLILYFLRHYTTAINVPANQSTSITANGLIPSEDSPLLTPIKAKT